MHLIFKEGAAVRCHKNKPLPPCYAIKNTKHCADVFRMYWEKTSIAEHERIYVLYLNAKNEPLMFKLLNIGTLNSVLFNKREAVKYALTTRARRIAIAHNHTNGVLEPSLADIEFTNEFLELLQGLDIDFMDHIILTENGYYSFKDHGYLKV